MKNSRSATGVGAGELSEYVLSQTLLERHCGISGQQLHEAVTLAAAAGQRHALVGWKDATGAARQLRYRFDGKTLEAVAEFELHLERSNELVSELQKVSETVADTLQVPLPIVELRALGASGSKADLTVIGADGTSCNLSLKYGHHASARYQSAAWSGVLRPYRVIGADISSQKAGYLAAHRSFITPQLRHSRKRGDYSAALRQNCDGIVAAHHQINQHLAANPELIDRAQLAAGVLRSYTGAAAGIHLVDMKSGQVVQLRRDSQQRLHQLLQHGDLEVTASSSATGRTIEMTVQADGVEIIRLRTTASTNRAKGQMNSDLRVVKPQTYLIPNLSLLSESGTAAPSGEVHTAAENGGSVTLQPSPVRPAAARDSYETARHTPATTPQSSSKTTSSKSTAKEHPMTTPDRPSRAAQGAYTTQTIRRIAAAAAGVITALAVISRRRERTTAPEVEPVVLEELSDAERLSRVEASVAALHDRIDQVASALERTNRQRRWRH